MSIASEISRLQTAKADLKTAIEGKGVTVPSSIKLDGYADLVDSISGGGSDDDNWYLVLPNMFMRYVYEKTNDTTWEMRKAYSINLYTTGIYFEYKGEKYYVTDIIYGNNPLSKTGQPLANTPTAASTFDRATITKDANDNFTAYFRED